MTVLWIVLLSLLALLAVLILTVVFLRVRVLVRYDSRDSAFFAAAKLGFITLPLYPPRPKKRAVLSLDEELAKKARKDEKEKQKKAKGNGKSPLSLFRKELSAVARATHIGGAISSRRRKDPPDNSPVQKARRIAAAVRIFVARVRAFLPPFFDAIALSIDSLHITVAGTDAADTAIGYGIVCASLETLYAVNREWKWGEKHFHIAEDIRVDTDFCAVKTEFSLSAHADIRPFKLLVALYRAEDAYYTEKYR